MLEDRGGEERLAKRILGLTAGVIELERGILSGEADERSSNSAISLDKPPIKVAEA